MLIPTEINEFDNLVPITLIGPNGKEGNFEPRLLKTQIEDLREAVITNLYGEPIPELSKTLWEVSITVLDAQEKQQLDEWNTHNYGQWAHFTRELPSGGFVHVVLMREFTATWQEADFERPPSDDTFSSSISIDMLGIPDQEDRNLTIELENVKGGVVEDMGPSTYIKPVQSRKDPQITLYELAQSTLGAEKSNMLKQLTSVEEPLAQDTDSAANGIVFGGGMPAPAMLYPSINEIPFIGLTRGLRSTDEELVSIAIEMIQKGEVDPSINKHWGRNSLRLAQAVEGYTNSDD